MTTLDLPSLIAPQPNLKSLRVSNERYERDADFIFNLAVKKDRRLETGRILAARRKKLAPITITSSKSTGSLPGTGSPSKSTGSLGATRTKVAEGLGRHPKVPPTQRHALDPAQEEAAAAELEAKRRVFKLRKQLAEARTLQASVRIEEKNYQRWRDVREETAQLKKGALGAGSALDVPAATDEEVGKVSAAMMFQLAKMEVDPSKRAWYKLFKAMDENGDGHITFDELMVLIRKTVKLSEEDLSEKAVSAVWHSIDLDGNGWIDAGEFGRFFRLGEKPYREQRAKMFKEAIAEAKRIEPQEKSLAEVAVDEMIMKRQKLEEEEARLQQALMMTASVPELMASSRMRNIKLVTSPTKNTEKSLPPLR